MSNPNISEIAHGLDIVQICHSYGIELQGQGTRLKARQNPLRSENTSSFFVYEDTGRFFDFGSNEGGDAVDLIAKLENISLSDAREKALIFTGGEVTIKTTPTLPRPQAAEIDMDALFASQIAARIQADRAAFDGTIAQRLYELIHLDIWRSSEDTTAALSLIGYEPKEAALSIGLKDTSGRVQTLIYRNVTRDASLIKWYVKAGRRDFVPSKIRPTDDPIYVGFGTAENILFELLGVDYFCFQMDGVAKNIQTSPQLQSLRDAVSGRLIVLCVDNDESCKETIQPLKAAFDDKAVLTSVTFEDKPKGFDIRDFANEMAADAKREGGRFQVNSFLNQVVERMVEI